MRDWVAPKKGMERTLKRYSRACGVAIRRVMRKFGSAQDPTTTNPDLYRNNDLQDGGGSINTEMHGLTTVLTCTATVTPGETNHIKLAIAATSDSILDANVFLKSGSFSTEPPGGGDEPTSADQCKKGGWQEYGIFKNQGDCVSYVSTQAKNEPGKNLPNKEAAQSVTTKK